MKLLLFAVIGVSLVLQGSADRDKDVIAKKVADGLWDDWYKYARRNNAHFVSFIELRDFYNKHHSFISPISRRFYNLTGSGEVSKVSLTKLIRPMLKDLQCGCEA